VLSSAFFLLLTSAPLAAAARHEHHRADKGVGHSSSSSSTSHINVKMEGGGEVKTRWTELHAAAVDTALLTIKEERPELTVVKVVQGSMVTMDYRLDRVRVFYNEDTGLVTATPRVG